MNKSDSIIISHITKKSNYTEILKFIFHEHNYKYKYMLNKINKIYSKYIQSNTTPQQSSIINLICNLINVSNSTTDEKDKRKILSNVAINDVGFNSVLVDSIELAKDSSFENIDDLYKHVSDIVGFVESIQLISDNYLLLDNVLNQDIVSYNTITDTIKKTYSSLSNAIVNLTKNNSDNEFISITNVSSELDRLKEDSKNIFSIPTGIKIIDEYKLVTSCRLTMFASPTNHGKTTVISCIAARCMRSLLNNKHIYDSIRKVKTDKKLAICFISLEESDIDIRKRLLSNILSENRANIEKMDSITAEYKIKQHLKHEDAKNIVLYVKYMPAGSTVTDVESIIQNIQNQDIYPVLIVIDYLDKLTSTLVNSDIYRLQLTSVSYELRNISLKYNVPIVTATQLNKESIVRAKLDLDLIAESYGKTWEADSVVVFRQRIKNNMHFLELSIPKSRHTNRLVDPVLLQMDYSKNEIIDNIIYTSFDCIENRANVQNNDTKTNNSDNYIYELDI